jgi:hypothetical protein
MLTYFPKIYPGELLYSVVARLMCHSGILSSRHLPEQAFGRSFWRMKTFLQTNLGRLAENLPPSFGLTAHLLAAETTLLPYFTAYRPQQDRDWALAALAGDDGSAHALYGRLGLMPSSVRLPTVLRYCLACRAKMLRNPGELYWRRDHQLPGVLVCPIHGTPLADSQISLAHTSRHEFIAANEDNCPPSPAPPGWADQPNVVKLLQAIAIASANLLTEPPPAKSLAAWGEEVRVALRSHGFSPRGLNTDQRALVDTFSTHFGPVLDILPEASHGGWLKAITNEHKQSFAPLHHILIRLLIESLPRVEARNPFVLGPWSCRNPLVEHYGQSVITNCKVHKRHGKIIGVFSCSCGYVFSTASGPGGRAKILDLGEAFKVRLRELVAAGEGLCNTAKALHVTPNTVLRYAALLALETPWKGRRVYTKLPPIDRDAMRAAWTDGHTAAPHLIRTQLRCEIPAVYGWLYSNDRAWLEEQPPFATTNSRIVPRVNWSDLDAEKAAILRREAARLRAQIPPQKITCAALERAVGQTDWLTTRLHKLPLCTIALADLTESLEKFQRRRITWAAQELQKREAPISVSRLRRLIHLKTDRSQEIEALLRETAGEI